VDKEGGRGIRMQMSALFGAKYYGLLEIYGVPLFTRIRRVKPVWTRGEGESIFRDLCVI